MNNLTLLKFLFCLFFIFFSTSFQTSAESGIYDRIGIIAEHGMHGAVPEENIDLFTGNLTLRNLDIHLPGPNGFDLDIWRIYNSKVLKDRLFGSAWGIQQEPYSWVGIGWSMHMGRLHYINSETPVIEYPDGRWETAYHDIDDYSKFITRDFAKLDKSNWKLYFKDGTVWTFAALANVHYGSMIIEQVRVVTQITNSYGHQINITYDASGSPRLKTITDSMARTVTFVLANNNFNQLARIDVKNANGGTVSYYYTVDKFNGDFNKLTSFNPPELPAVTYEYGDGMTSNWELLAVNTSYGGRMEYEYADHTFNYQVYPLQTKVISKKKIKFSSDAMFKTWDYTYPSYNNAENGTVEVNGPEYTTYATYHAYTSSTPWSVGLIKEKSVDDGSFSEQYEWTVKTISNTHWYVLNIDMGKAAAPLQSSVAKTLEGDADSRYDYLYERAKTSRFGLPTQIKLYANGSLKSYRKLVYYFENSSAFESKYMLTHLKSDTQCNAANAKIRETAITYLANGAIDTLRKWKAGSTYLEWDYTYSSSNPNLITITVDLPGYGGTETMIYKYGILATMEHPTYTEFNRSISQYDSSILSETNQHGATMNFSYDDLGRITKIDMPSGFNDVQASWSNNSVAISQDDNVVTKYWDGMGRNTGYKEQGDGITLYHRKTLDSDGRVIAESKGSTNSGDEYEYVLNAAGQAKKVTDPRGKATNIKLGTDQKTITDANNNSTILEYKDLPGLVTKLTDPSPTHKTASYSYDGAGRLLNTTFNSSRTQSYTYNGLDQVTSESHPETGPITYVYSTANNVESKTWGGVTTEYLYNTSNQVLQEDAEDEAITYAYDSKGRLASASGALGWSRTAIGYNTLGAITQETINIPGLGGKTLSYSYDGNNQLKEMTYPDGMKAVYANNGLNMPETVGFNGNTLVNAIAYGIAKQPTTINFSANNTSYIAAYNGIGGMTNAQLKKSGTYLYNAEYGYDNVGNITSLNNTNPSLNASYDYDSLNRLTGASYTPSGVGRVNYFVYNYDEYGNMTLVKENTATVFNKSYTNQNRISGFSYDNRGNLTQGGGFSQVWDNRNRMSESKTTATGTLLGRYLYDERGLRLKAERFAMPTVTVLKPNTTESIYQGDTYTISWSSTGEIGTIKLELLDNGSVVGTIAENLPAMQTSYEWQVGKLLSGTVTPGSNFKIRVSSMVPSTIKMTYYLHDHSGRLLAEYDQSGSCVKDYINLKNRLLAEYLLIGSKYYYYTSDQINSTRIITDSSGAVVYSAVFDPYGGMQKQWVNTYDPKLKFSGKEREGSSEMDYFGARYYGHKQYRFLSVDPVINKEEAKVNPQLWNLYSYCINNPITFSDPDGRRINPITRKWGIPNMSNAQFSLSPSGIIAMGDTYFERGTWGAIRPNNRTHRGVDLIAHIGDPVYNAESGIVILINRADSGEAGRRVRIQTQNETILTYAHLDAIDDNLSLGNYVVEGQKIGTVGISGNANNNGNPLPGYFVHLHFAVNDSQGNSINAERWLNNQNFRASTFTLNSNNR
jgi:RHS repeat-associated protein